MTALSTRDALAKALLECTPDSIGGDDWFQKFADNLIASGAVVDAATLADEIERRIESSVFPVPPGSTLRADNGYLSATTMRAHLREVFASLTDRAS